MKRFRLSSFVLSLPLLFGGSISASAVIAACATPSESDDTTDGSTDTGVKNDVASEEDAAPPCDDACTTSAKCEAGSCKCPEGTTGDGRKDGSGCKDTDECTTNPCVGEAKCNNTFGSFSCTCPPGSTGDGKVNGTGCGDKDECAEANDCSANALCINSIGTYFCKCPSGYTGDGKTKGSGCTDADECTDGSKPCVASATCTNTVGSFNCACAKGYTGDGKTAGSGCADTNECLSNPCVANAACTNTPGSFTCKCAAGYAGDGIPGGTGCADINECSGVNDCVATATCFNAIGSYSCVCPIGQLGDGRKSGTGCSSGGLPRIYVSDYNLKRIAHFPLSASGNVAPTRSVTLGYSPRLMHYLGGTDEMWISDQAGGTVNYYSLFSTRTGALTPSRSFTLTGSSLDLAYDTTNNRLYAAGSAGIAIFDNASALNGGTPTPSRAVTGTGTVRGIDFDSISGRLFATGITNNQVYAFDSPATMSGDIASVTKRAFTAPASVLGTSYTRNTDRLYAGSSAGSVFVWSNASTASGTAPVATLSGGNTQLASNVTDVFVDPVADELYVVDPNLNRIAVFAGASTFSGTVNVAPTRTILGANTGFTQSYGIWVNR